MPSEVYLGSGEAMRMVKRFGIEYQLQSLRKQPFAWKNPTDGHWYFKREELMRFLKLRKGSSKWKLITCPKDKNRLRMWKIIALNKLRVSIYQGKEVIHREDFDKLQELLDRKSIELGNEEGYKNEN